MAIIIWDNIIFIFSSFLNQVSTRMISETGVRVTIWWRRDERVKEHGGFRLQTMILRRRSQEHFVPSG